MFYSNVQDAKSFRVALMQETEGPKHESLDVYRSSYARRNNSSPVTFV